MREIFVNDGMTSILLGRKGENEATKITFDIADWIAEYPQATFALINQKPNSTTEYPVVISQPRDGKVSWVVGGNELLVDGYGQCTLEAVEGNVVAKRHIWRTRILTAMGEPGEFPEPWESWLTEFTRLKGEAEDAQEAAEDAAEDSEAWAVGQRGGVDVDDEDPTYENNAKYYAILAQTALDTAIAEAEAAAAAAETAQGKAEDAQEAAEDAQADAEAAQAAAELAKSTAESAASTAEAAEASALVAQGKAEAAQGKAEDAQEAAETAQSAAATSAATANTARAQTENLLAETITAKNAAVTAQGKAEDAQDAAEDAQEAAEEAQTAAEAAQAGAIVAKGKAEDAQGAAETAQGKAEDAQEAAEAAQTGAETAQGAAETAQTAAETAQSAAEDAQEAAEAAQEAAEEAAEEALETVESKAPAIYEEIENAAIASMNDGAENMLLKKLEVAIEPVQDLHGYDHPWPAGASPQIWDEEYIYQSERIQSKNYIPVLPETTYYRKSPNNIIPFYYDSTYTQIGTGTWGTGNFITPANTSFIKFQVDPAYGNTYKNDISINYPATETAYYRYSNDCPISGWESANVWDDPAYGGSIKWNQILENGNFANTTGWTGNGTLSVSNNKATTTGTTTSYINVRRSTPENAKKDHIYLLSADVSNSGGVVQFVPTDTASQGNALFENLTQEKNISYLWKPSADFSTARYVIRFNVTTSGTSEEITATVRNYCVFDLTEMFGETVADSVYAMEQATAGSGVAWFRNLFPNDYYAYNAGEVTTVSAVNGNTYRHAEYDFPQAAGTVLGGKLTIHQDGTGTLLADYGKHIANSSSLRRNDGNRWYIPQSYTGAIKPSADSADTIVSNVFKSELGWEYKNQCFINSSGNIRFNTSEEFESIAALLEGIPTMEFVYKLAEPVVYNLTAQDVIALLKGNNNLWADCGNISIEYPADTKLYIDGKIAEIQALILENISNS